MVVSYDYDPSANLKTYRTYDWLPGPQEATGDKRIDNSLTDMRIRIAVASQLELKGYTKPVAGQPDFYVVYHASVKDLLKTTSMREYYGYGVAEKTGSGGWPGGNRTVTDIESYKEGSLLLDVIDVREKRLVWRGTAQAKMDPTLTPEERNERARVAVRKMLEHFPPR
jgi:Domain of unknown function (DUF4136)